MFDHAAVDWEDERGPPNDVAYSGNKDKYASWHNRDDQGGRVRKRQAVSKTQSGDKGLGGLTSMVCGRRTMSGRLVATARLLWVAIVSKGSLSSVFWLRKPREKVSRILAQRVESGLAV